MGLHSDDDAAAPVVRAPRPSAAADRPTRWNDAPVGMDRREALRALLWMAMGPVAAGCGTRHEARSVVALRRAASAGLGAHLRTLTPHSNRLVVALADTIIPETETPGATSARVNEFIDLMLTDWYSEEERKQLVEGLVTLDERAKGAFGAGIAECSAQQRVLLVTELERESADIPDSLDSVARPQPNKAAQTYVILRKLTIVGYQTSEQYAG